MFGRKKKRGKRKKHKSAVRKIYKTTDGYLSGRADIKKPRRVAVIHQRKDDGALAVVKIYSKKDKQGKAFLKRPVLKPKKHPSLSEPSIVGKKVHIGSKDGATYKPIAERYLKPTGDKLTFWEKLLILFGVRGKTKEQRKAHKAKMKKWHNHFKK
ncbi:MAG: hypothetical protein ACLSU0_04750 [Oscillospiraceae bacterium]